MATMAAAMSTFAHIASAPSRSPTAIALKFSATLTLTIDDVPREILEVEEDSIEVVSPLATAEKDAVLKALAECAGNKTKAADALGISRRTLHRKLNEWRIK